MSIIVITEHDENIYKILDKPPPAPPKPKRYESDLEKKLKATKIPQLCRTFGHAQAVTKRPDQFMKKGQGFTKPIEKTDHVCFKRHLSPVPKRPKGKPPKRPEKNMVQMNIEKMDKCPAKPPNPRLVDTKDGHIKTIKGSGEVPEYCKRPDFGQMPAYLVKRNKYLARQARKRELEIQNRPDLCQFISKEEREKLLTNLKHNWALMQKAFLRLPMLTDTVPKINQKTKLEQELKDIEKDIRLVEENPYIYVFEKPEIK